MVKKHATKANSRSLKASMRGFLITCDSAREAEAAAELKALVEKKVPRESVSKEESAASQRPRKSLKLVSTGCKGVLFLKLNPGHSASSATDPAAFVSALFTATNRQTNAISRVVPVIGTCSASDREQVATFLVETVQKTIREKGMEGDLRVEFVARNNATVKKEEVLAAIRRVRKVTETTSSNSPTPTVLIHVNRRLLLFALLQGAGLPFNFILKRYYRLKHIV